SPLFVLVLASRAHASPDERRARLRDSGAVCSIRSPTDFRSPPLSQSRVPLWALYECRTLSRGASSASPVIRRFVMLLLPPWGVGSAFSMWRMSKIGNNRPHGRIPRNRSIRRVGSRRAGRARRDRPERPRRGVHPADRGAEPGDQRGGAAALRE